MEPGEGDVKKCELTKDEKEKIVEAFKLFDKDNNGFIDEQELADILESMHDQPKIVVLGQKPMKEDIKNMLAEVGAEADQRICKSISDPSALESFLKLMTDQKTNYALEDDHDIS